MVNPNLQEKGPNVADNSVKKKSKTIGMFVLGIAFIVLSVIMDFFSPTRGLKYDDLKTQNPEFEDYSAGYDLHRRELEFVISPDISEINAFKEMCSSVKLRNNKILDWLYGKQHVTRVFLIDHNKQDGQKNDIEYLIFESKACNVLDKSLTGQTFGGYKYSLEETGGGLSFTIAAVSGIKRDSFLGKVVSIIPFLNGMKLEEKLDKILKTDTSKHKFSWEFRMDDFPKEIKFDTIFDNQNGKKSSIKFEIVNKLIPMPAKWSPAPPSETPPLDTQDTEDMDDGRGEINIDQGQIDNGNDQASGENNAPLEIGTENPDDIEKSITHLVRYWGALAKETAPYFDGYNIGIKNQNADDGKLLTELVYPIASRDSDGISIRELNYIRDRSNTTKHELGDDTDHLYWFKAERLSTNLESAHFSFYTKINYRSPETDEGCEEISSRKGSKFRCSRFYKIFVYVEDPASCPFLKEPRDNIVFEGNACNIDKFYLEYAGDEDKVKPIYMEWVQERRDAEGIFPG